MEAAPFCLVIGFRLRLDRDPYRDVVSTDVQIYLNVCSKPGLFDEISQRMSENSAYVSKQTKFFDYGFK
jgi:hypothetical protein